MTYSPALKLSLIVGDDTFPLSQIGPGYVILRKAVSMDPCDAEIVVAVDGENRHIPVRLVDGANVIDKHVAVCKI